MIAASPGVREIAVVGPGIVGMPMAALLAKAGLDDPSGEGARVVVIQRRSNTSGWKVDAINEGRSPIGGIEPSLDNVVRETVATGHLRASHDYAAARTADVILVCVQTDRKGYGPDYGPLFEALTGLAEALREKPEGHRPVIVFESTLAPSTMTTLIREHFARYGLEEGRDVLLGNSPNRVMPGRLVERVTGSDKIVAGLSPETPERIAALYGGIVRTGTLHRTNSLTAEVVKTLENAYRDVRIAFAAEIVRYCDEQDVDFYAVRDAVNRRIAQSDTASADPRAIPTGGLLVPTIGVGGHCLPKDGILLWWRRLEAGADPARSLILMSRCINDESPAYTIGLAERAFGSLAGRRVGLLGAAYRPDSEDTRNSPSIAAARLLRARGSQVTLHDPYVAPRDQNLERFGLQAVFTGDLEAAVGEADVVVIGTAHGVYADARPIRRLARRLKGVVDGCNLYRRSQWEAERVGYTGIGRGRRAAPDGLIEYVTQAFRAVERGLANEVVDTIDFLNDRYAGDQFGRVDFREVQRIAGTCVTGCAIADPGPVESIGSYDGFTSRLAALAAAA